MALNISHTSRIDRDYVLGLALFFVGLCLELVLISLLEWRIFFSIG